MVFSKPIFLYKTLVVSLEYLSKKLYDKSASVRVRPLGISGAQRKLSLIKVRSAP